VAQQLRLDDKMPEEHRHCIVCGKVVDPEKFFCSPACENTYKQQQKRMSRMRLIMMVILVVMVMVVLVLSALRGS